MFRQFINLCFEQIGNRADVHAAVAVFGEKAHAEIFHFVARARHQQLMKLAVVVQRGHPQARACVGKGQILRGVQAAFTADAAFELLECGR